MREARARGERMRDISLLRGLQRQAKQAILSTPDMGREIGLQRILTRARSIGERRRVQFPLEPVFDNEIKAMQLRIEGQHNRGRIQANRQRANSINCIKRDRVVDMEERIKRRIKVANEQRLARIKQGQLQGYYDAQRRLLDKNLRVRMLERLEQSMISQLGTGTPVQQQHDPSAAPENAQRHDYEYRRGLVNKLRYLRRVESYASDPSQPRPKHSFLF